MLLEVDECIDLNECASSSMQRESNQRIQIIIREAANHEDETQFVAGRFLEGSE